MGTDGKRLCRQSAAEVDETLRAVAGGQVKILFTSPERLLGGKLLKVLSELPPLR